MSMLDGINKAYSTNVGRIRDVMKGKCSRKDHANLVKLLILAVWLLQINV